MKTKFFLAALALPMLFTACSSEDEMMTTTPTGPEGVEGIKVNLGVIKDGEAGSRSSWTGSKIAFDEGDALSAYWVNADGNNGDAASNASATAVPYASNYAYTYNSVYQNNGGETGWTSESMLFYGGNIMVFPADKTAYTTGSPILLKVEQVQANKSIDAKMPYYSNYVLIRKSRGSQTDNIAGYNQGKGLNVALKPAANVLELTINMKNYADLVSKYGFEVKDVELVSANNAFATQAQIVDNNTTAIVAPKYTAKWTHKSGGTTFTYTSIEKVLDINATPTVQSIKSKDVEDKGNGMYKVRFMILPTQLTGAEFSADADARIIVHTNCGRVVLESNSLTGAGKVKKDWDDAELATEKTIAQAFVDITSYTAATSSSSNFTGEKVGKAKIYSVECDMANTILNASEVEKDADIVRYLNLYTDMNRLDNMTLVMNAGTGKPFPDLQSTTIDRVNGNAKWALASLQDKVNLVSGGEVKDLTRFATSASDADVTYAVKSQVSWVLAGNKSDWTMNDDKDLKNYIKEVVINSGSTLTLKGQNGKIVKENINNDKGTLMIGGNGILTFGANGWYKSTDNAASKIEIGASQTLNFNATSAQINGTINNKGFLLAGASGFVVNNAVVNNWGTMASSVTGTTKGFQNKKTVNVKDDLAITYITDNSTHYNAEPGKGAEIVLKSRTNEVSTNAGNEGKITYAWTTADGTKVKKENADRFTNLSFGSFGVLTLDPGVHAGTAQDDVFDLTGVSMEFKGTTRLISNNVTINNLWVVAGANLQVLTGNILNVTDLTNKGTITVGGTINVSGTKVEGKVLSQGGSIN